MKEGNGTTGAPVLSLRGLGIACGERAILRDIDLDVAGSGCTVLLGPSGTGKSALLRTVAGYNRGSAALRSWGEVAYQGRPAGPGHAPALVMQNSRLLVATVLENLVCELPGRSGLTRGMQIELLRPWLAGCGQSGLLQLLARQVVELPLAQQRIVAILREAIAGPALLMVDEPTADLGGADAGQVLAVLRDLVRARPLLVVLHNVQEARLLADHVVLIAGGRLQEAGASAAFFAGPASESGQRFLATGSCPEPGGEAVDDVPSAQPSPVRPVPLPAGIPSTACGPRGFVWLLPGRLAGTPWPGVIHGANYDLQALRAMGVTRLVSLTEQPFDAALAAPHGIGCLSFPMPDMQPPTHAQALALCRRLDALLAAGEVVAVHCHAGLGRTGTVLAAYWLWLGGGRLDAVRALEDVRRLEPGWVQSREQVVFLEEFALVVADSPAAGRVPNDPAAARDAAAPTL